jgi:hypothetical protein
METVNGAIVISPYEKGEGELRVLLEKFFVAAGSEEWPAVLYSQDSCKRGNAALLGTNRT